MTIEITKRYTAAQSIARDAGALALKYFNSFDTLTIESKSHQDFVSEADKNVETLVRAAIAQAFPDDAIVGEEDAPTTGTSGFTWVIDPVDGTTNFIHGIPQWCVAIAIVQNAQTVAGVIHDPVHGECNHAMQGGGAFTNDKPIRVLAGRPLTNGSLGVGFSGRTRASGNVITLIDDLTKAGGVFWRNGSGALSLAYVAQGKLLGYVEEHMNAWDCLAGQLMIAEAGGKIETQNADDMIANGGRVLVATAEVFDQVQALADAAYGR
ncbi:inositol monophosphatase family protein [Pseudorhodobacter ferrugineus]|uniref:inositol monophosphatase family protein n=1 Tax=Pseudorhodobacter ferrugineus TaxID=77008 RepID=UPI0003B39E62|nr:inositol monophosphatase [Pseudorhodobacter ferrugineus]